MRKLLIILMLTIIAVPAMAQEQAHDHPADWLKPIKAEYVCMVNDKAFDSTQIPVPVEGKTYYGCCAGCKATLENNPSSRMATDPVSGKSVDKAEAVIGAGPDKTIYYFENEENFQKFADGSMPEADMTKDNMHAD